MGKILFLAFVFYVLQCFFMYRQMNHFKTIVKDFMTKGHVGIGEKKYKLAAGNVVVLVSDDAGRILEAKQMKGRTVLARFKNIVEWQGKNVRILRREALQAKKQNKALLQALDNLEEKLSLS
ncbi:transcriptional regulator GutM [Pectinatus frisingensis]|uniref:transcriptional regulator GutM n=1 Tax=Pectinatus frisingensis TaxID=865 RepID=UPI0018C7B9DE|nr:transcriptional regulator GutM [Pectinatus frisingensis]